LGSLRLDEGQRNDWQGLFDELVKEKRATVAQIGELAQCLGGRRAFESISQQFTQRLPLIHRSFRPANYANEEWISATR
jgi:hypothetical protein